MFLFLFKYMIYVLTDKLINFQEWLIYANIDNIKNEIQLFS